MSTSDPNFDRMSTAISVTHHAATRMRQRGFCDDDLEVILDLGHDSENGKIVLADSDIDEAIAAKKREIIRLDRLRGATAVLVGGRLVTIYKRRKHGRRRNYDRRADR